MASSGQNIHGEVDFLMSYQPASVLDAGCGTGRVAIELDRRGIHSVGVDLDPQMLEEAKRKAPTIGWHQEDLRKLELQNAFDVVVLAGNVMIFLEPGSELKVLGRMAHHVDKGGLLISGFSIRPEILPLERYDSLAEEVGLSLAGRWSTWQRDPFEGGAYAVSAHRKAD
ncbi:MAG: SAM-dependent methyltransferase [Acidimicrobiaceae bacterium]|nr:SAM-dependent methyltransferase [Acidimicrobiaceae bacterium]|tara:strand:- start:3166 stop:3672 length:507 start_codon:yes stop_codon:yes gene_type:complete